MQALVQLSSGGSERCLGGGGGICTLLGPEGPEQSASSGAGWTEPLDPFPRFTLVDRGGGYRPYFENYTVDASILDSGLCPGSQRSKQAPFGVL
jgi:hypothetical protein